MIYVIAACHFQNSSQLCRTTIERLRLVRERIKESDNIIVTGDVPYELSGPTLGELMKGWLVKERVPESSVIIHKGGVGTFSEARLVCEDLKASEEITVISSPWYFFQAKPIWKRRARENSHRISFLSVSNTGGSRTWATYIILGIIFRGAVLLGLERVVEKYTTASQEQRREGFKWNGCR